MSGSANTTSMLPDELWVKILSLLAPKRDLKLRTVSVRKLAQDQRNLYRARSVCSRFNKLFLESAKLSKCLIVEWCLQPVCIPNLQAWLRCHSCCVETVMAECGTPALEMVLGALLTQPQHLKTLALGQPQGSDMRMAACFTSLASLGLDSSDPSQDLNISALQALPHLKTLSLYDGEYRTSELHEGLLTLLLENANLELGHPATCVVPLQNLRVVFSHFSRVHKDGILAYTTLQELYLHNGSVDGSCTSHVNTVEFGECYDDRFRCPDLSPLKSLTVLYMNVSGSLNDEPIDWVCLYCLSSLQALTLHFTTRDVKVDQNLTRLGNLTSLKLIGAALPYERRSYMHVVSVTIDVNWGAMPTLQNIYIESDRLQFGPNMLELLQVSGLRSVTFLDSKRVTAEPPATFTALVQGLTVQRPGVTLIVNGSRKQSVHCKRTCT